MQAPPDIIRIEITVSKLDKRDAARAEDHVDEVASKAAAALAAQGVREQDITASSLS